MNLGLSGGSKELTLLRTAWVQSGLCSMSNPSITNPEGNGKQRYSDKQEGNDGRPCVWEGRVPSMGTPRTINGDTTYHQWGHHVPSMGTPRTISGDTTYHQWGHHVPSMGLFTVSSVDLILSVMSSPPTMAPKRLHSCNAWSQYNTIPNVAH